jgi:ketosteroid isomerase-like protein
VTTNEVANRLVELCKKGEFAQATRELYAPNIVSVEAFPMHGMPRETTGTDGVLKKGEWWTANHTIHKAEVTGPYTSVDKFSVVFDMDVTNTPSGKRMAMIETAVYTVSNGKIVHEEFLYKPQ